MTLLKWVDRKENVGIGVGFFLVLLVLWPNLVHEPLHALALKLMGLPFTIQFDWLFPVTPSITATVLPQTAIAWLFYLLLPSIVSICILIWIALTCRKATLTTHVILPMYLVLDLVINVRGYARETSDFRFLTGSSALIVTLILLVAGAYVIYLGLRDEMWEAKERAKERNKKVDCEVKVCGS